MLEGRLTFTGRILRTFPLRVLVLLASLAGSTEAAIPEPSVVLYGTVKVDGIPLQDRQAGGAHAAERF